MTKTVVRRILVIAGTRPEIIKLAPVIRLARAKYLGSVELTFCLTGQHQAMADQAMQMFALTPDANLEVMQPDQTINAISARVLERLPSTLQKFRPDVLVVQGDTTTAAAAAWCGFNLRIPVAHVEAGLRSFNLDAPFPEELNRRIISTCARYNFCPTRRAEKNLRSEGIPESTLHVTGNTIVDSLEYIAEMFDLDNLAGIHHGIRKPFILITAHRRESFGSGFQEICGAIRECAQLYPDMQYVYPVHLNPHVKGPVEEKLAGLPNVLLTGPVPYMQLLTLMKHSEFILTDSGGIQEEAPSFGKYCIVMRDVTERMESVDEGISELVGAHRTRIIKAVQRQLKNPKGVERGKNPYGDGKASQRILDALLQTPRQ